MTPVVPATGPISERAISASDRPPRRVEAHSVIEVVDGAGQAAAGDSQMKPGAQPNCAASTGPTSGPAPVMAAK